MPYSGFKDFIKLTGNSGQFPDALVPASSAIFAYSYQIDLTDQLEFSTGDLLTVDITVTFDVLDPSGTVILEVVLDATYLAGQDEFGFTEYVTQQSVTLTPTVPTLGDPTGIIVPGNGGVGAESGADIIFDTFETPIITLAIPAGSTVKITHHTAGYPSLDDIESLQVSTKPGGSTWVSGFRHDGDGEAQLFYEGKTAGQTARVVGRDRALTASDPWTAWGVDGQGALLRTPGGGNVLALYPRKGTVYGRFSASDGSTYGDEMTLYANMTLLDAIEMDGETLIFMQDKTGAVFTARGDRSGTFADPAAALIPAGMKLVPGRLVNTGGRLDFYWTGTDGLDRITSTTDGATWTDPNLIPSE